MAAKSLDNGRGGSRLSHGHPSPQWASRMPRSVCRSSAAAPVGQQDAKVTVANMAVVIEAGIRVPVWVNRLRTAGAQQLGQVRGGSIIVGVGVTAGLVRQEVKLKLQLLVGQRLAERAAQAVQPRCLIISCGARPDPNLLRTNGQSRSRTADFGRANLHSEFTSARGVSQNKAKGPSAPERDRLALAQHARLAGDNLNQLETPLGGAATAPPVGQKDA